MSAQIEKKKKPRPTNLTLLAISMIIFGGLGIIYITQMEFAHGWVWDNLHGYYPVNFYIFESNDITGDNFPEIICYADTPRSDDWVRNNTPQYGGVFLLNGMNGKPIWAKEFNGPVKYMSPIMDVDDDGIKDYFICYASVAPYWSSETKESICYPNKYSNQIISGGSGESISILTGDGKNFTNLELIDLIYLNNLNDNQEDIICLHRWNLQSIGIVFNITSYYVNGTKKYEVSFQNAFEPLDPNFIKAIELFPHINRPHLLIIGNHSYALQDITSINYSKTIYQSSSILDINSFSIIKDLNGDQIPEFIISTFDGKLRLINGVNGNILKEVDLLLAAYESVIKISDFSNTEGDGSVGIILDIVTEDSSLESRVFTISLISYDFIELWSRTRETITHYGTHVLNDDLNNDGFVDLILEERFTPFGSTQDTNRFTYVSGKDGSILGIVNMDIGPFSIISIPDFDDNGKKDFVIGSWGKIIALSSQSPIGIWLSPDFSFGLPLFVFLAFLLIAGTAILIIKGRKLRFDIRTSIKKNKLTFIVNIIIITLVTINFLLFLSRINIFNSTLLAIGIPTFVSISFLIEIIIWYGMLPLTAAIYNKFSPKFAYLLIKIRKMFFKISKSNVNEILILKMDDREELGTLNTLRRIIVPLLLSISIGFLSYNILAPVLGFPQSFIKFGSDEFLRFMGGYTLLCTIPMIFTFTIFSFFISGNWLLDDAGVVYYIESKKYRKPGDIEPISIWSSSLIKGIAGISSILTFTSFFLSVDLSGFVKGDNIIILIFGAFMLITMFWGTPFLTTFCYMLFAISTMDFSLSENTQKLYDLLQRKGYDITPHKLTNLYPSGYQHSND